MYNVGYLCVGHIEVLAGKAHENIAPAPVDTLLAHRTSHPAPATCNQCQSVAHLEI